LPSAELIGRSRPTWTAPAGCVHQWMRVTDGRTPMTVFPAGRSVARRSLSVIPGLDPGIQPPSPSSPCWRWIAGSGPAMTAARHRVKSPITWVPRSKRFASWSGSSHPDAPGVRWIYCPMVYSMLLDQVGAHFRSMNLLYEDGPTRQGGHEVVSASPKAVSTASPGEGSTSPAVLGGLSAGTRGDNAMTRTYRQIAIEEMLRTVQEAMS